MSSPAGQQPELERVVTRIARRAADAVALSVADLGTQLALAQETMEGQAGALADKDQQLADRDAELARYQQAAAELRARVTELEAEAAAGGGDQETLPA